MKKNIQIMAAVAAAAALAVSCEKTFDNTDAATVKHSVTFAAHTPETRTAFGEKSGEAYPTAWEGNETAAFFADGVAAVTAEADGKGKSTVFNVEFTDEAAKSATKFYAVSPASAYAENSVVIAAEQTPYATSCDPAAQLLLGATEEIEAGAESAAMSFSHLTAYGRFSYNLPEGVGEVKSVTLSATNSKLAGAYTLAAEDGSLTVSEGVNSLKIYTSSLSDIWFASAPAEFSASNTLSVAVETEKIKIIKNGIYSNNKGNLKFEKGIVAEFGVALNRVPSTVFDLEKLETLHSLSESSYTLPLVDAVSVAEWSSSDESVATVSDGVVTFVKYGTVDIIAKIDDTWSVAAVLDIPAGYYDEIAPEFWKVTTNGATQKVIDNYLEITPNDGTAYRGDLVRSVSPVNMYLSGDYPIICFRLDVLTAQYSGERTKFGYMALKFDTNADTKPNGTDGNDYTSELPAGDNGYKYQYVLEDNSSILIYDLSQQVFSAGIRIPMKPGVVAQFDKTFQLKYADVATGDTKGSGVDGSTKEDAKYRFFWFKTFKTIDDLNKYLETEGLAYKQIK